MANRLTRDGIVVAALNAVDSPSLDEKERPSGSLTGTLGTTWLQMALDYFYKVFPIKGVLVRNNAMTTIVGDSFLTVPVDFLADYPDGLRWETADGKQTQSRVRRRGLSYIYGKDFRTLDTPRWYAVVNDTQLLLRPVPDKVYVGTLIYYKLPAALGSSDIPPFPDDQILTDYMEIRYKEWLKAVPKGSALEYMRGQVSALQKAGIGNEPEPDQIPFDPDYYGERWHDQNAWMGEPNL